MNSIIILILLQLFAGTYEIQQQQQLPVSKSRANITNNGRSNQRRSHTGNFWIEEFHIKRHPTTDLIGDKPAQFYLKNPKVAKIAKDFYLGKFRPKDNDSTEHLLDLVTMTDKSIRPFYRWCLDQTIIIADGALGEYPGEPALKYASLYPIEFFAYMDKDKSGQRYTRWIGQISYSGLPFYDNPPNYKKLEAALNRQLSSHCQSCSIQIKRRLKKMSKDIIEFLKER